MIQWVKVFTAQQCSHDLSSIPRTHINVEGENHLHKVVL